MDDCVSGLCLKRSFLEDLCGRSVIEPRSLWRLGWTWALCLILACFAAFAQNPAYPTREYIRLGDRLIAIENAASPITILSPTRNVIGPGETAQFGKTVTGIPAESVRWTVESGPGTISLEGGLYQAPTPVTTEQTATIKATSTADASVVARSSILVKPLLVPANFSVSATGGTGLVAVTKEGAWTATASSEGDWLTITSGASGTGNGQVEFTVTANSGDSRTGTLTIAGTAFVVTQAAGSGTPTFNSTGVSGVPHTATSLTVGVSAPANVDWVAASSDPSWLVIDSGGSGRGNGTISYHVTANSGYNPRLGQLTIGTSAPFSVSQNGKPPELTGCSNIPALVPRSGGGPYSLTLGAADGATWSAAVAPSGAVTFVPATGTGSAQIGVTFQSNGTVVRQVNITLTVNGSALPPCSTTQEGMATLELDISAIPMFASWSQQFNAIRTDSRGNKSNVNTEATWSIDGSLPPDQAGIVIGGNYTAPSSITSPLTVVLRATHTFQGEVLTDTATISLGTFYPTESVAAITPSTGSAVPGTFQEFLLTVPLSGHDYNAAYRWPIELHFSESASAVANSCKIVWVTGGVHGSAGLVDDDGNPPPQFYALHGVASPTPDNLQCAVDLQQSYLYIQPGYVNEYLHFYIRFKPRFAGPKMIYLQVFDNLTGSYLVAPGTNLGTFLIPGYQPPSLAIETPATGATVSGAAVPITGWALDNAAQEETAISKVEVYVDGTKVGDAQYGLAHATACSSGQYPGRPGCPNVGYSFNWNSASVANGEHTILVSATDTDLLSGLADPHVASKAITVTVANTVSVAVSPATATLYRAQTTQFTAQVQGTTNTGVTWSLSPLVGTITAAGLYTAPDSITSQQTVQVIATSLADGTKTAQAVVTLVPVTLSLSLSDVSLNLNQTQQFTASLTPAGSGLNWSLSPSLGALSTTTTTVATNTYTAPSAVNSAQTVILTVSSVLDPSKAAQATIHLVPIAISVSPATVQLTAYQTQDFTATVTGTSNTAYTWALSPSVGTVSSTGHYEAPGSIEAQQTVTISATSSADPSKVATAAIILAPPVAEAPVNVSMTPSSGFGLTQTFSFVSSSTNGYRYIRSMHALFNYSTTAGGACYANYDATSNTLYLMSDNNDPGATTSGVLGSTGSLENAECRIDLGASSTSGSFNSLTLNLAITFKAGLPGPQNAYMLTYDMDYRYAGWEQKGTWTTSTVLSTAPTAVSVTPSFGTGMAATLSFVGSSANGYSYIPDLMALVSSTVTGTNACFVYYNRPRNCVTLLTDSGAWGQCSSLGTVGTLENSQCSLDLATSSASGAGNDLTLSLGLTFKTPYTGAKNTYLKVWDRANRTSDWVQLGTWNVGTN